MLQRLVVVIVVALLLAIILGPPKSRNPENTVALHQTP